MAADDDRDNAPDPWDEIVAESLSGGGDEVSFRFDEAEAPAEPAPAEPEGFPEPADAAEPVAEIEAVADAGAAEAADVAAEDALVEDWLAAEDGDAEAAVPPLTVFTPEEAAGGSSAIDIGTGTSGITLHGEAGQEEIGSDFFAGVAADEESAAGEWPGVDASAGDEAEDVAVESAADVGFPDLAAGGAVAAGVAVAATAPRPAKPGKPAKKKSGGIGQMIGVGLGGAMAIPITLAILIYGLGKDPFGVTKMVPRDAAFLLPQKFRPGYKKSAAASKEQAAGGSALDSLPTLDDSVPPVTEPAAEGETDAGNADAAPAEPVDPVDSLDAVADMPPADEPPVEADVPAMPEPALEPTDDASDAVAADAPGLDALAALDAATAPAPVAPPEPPPLDTAALDEAVVDASALGEALGAVDDKENLAYKMLRTRWYRALARVAEELVAVDNAAATSGRPLVGAPANVEALHGGIGSREVLVAELAALAPDWLDYAKRGSDGVVLPVTFASARKVGPLWNVRVTLTGADGQPRDLTVISRSEPAALAGDRLLVTGVAVDGAVIWAADVRAADLSAGF